MQLLLFQLARHFGHRRGLDRVPIQFFSHFAGIFNQVFEILESNLFQDNLMMALFSFGGVNDQCRAPFELCRKQECFLCCLPIMT